MNPEVFKLEQQLSKERRWRKQLEGRLKSAQREIALLGEAQDWISGIDETGYPLRPTWGYWKNGKIVHVNRSRWPNSRPQERSNGHQTSQADEANEDPRGRDHGRADPRVPAGLDRERRALSADS